MVTPAEDLWNALKASNLSLAAEFAILTQLAKSGNVVLREEAAGFSRRTKDEVRFRCLSVLVTSCSPLYCSGRVLLIFLPRRSTSRCGPSALSPAQTTDRFADNTEPHARDGRAFGRTDRAARADPAPRRVLQSRGRDRRRRARGCVVPRACALDSLAHAFLPSKLAGTMPSGCW